MSLSNSSETEIEGGATAGVSSSLHSERKKQTEGNEAKEGEESIKDDDTKENRSVAQGYKRPPPGFYWRRRRYFRVSRK